MFEGFSKNNTKRKEITKLEKLKVLMIGERNINYRKWCLSPITRKMLGF
jgi:hypothetical protein